ncbi:unnamed protein product, partial [Ectocarpus sp. 12 AP-2014]
RSCSCLGRTACGRCRRWRGSWAWGPQTTAWLASSGSTWPTSRRCICPYCTPGTAAATAAARLETRERGTRAGTGRSPTRRTGSCRGSSTWERSARPRTTCRPWSSGCWTWGPLNRSARSGA